MISSGIARRADMGVIFNAGGAFRDKTGLDLPYFCVNTRKELLAKLPDAATRLNAAFAECVATIEAEFPAIAARYAERTKIDAALLTHRESARALDDDQLVNITSTRRLVARPLSVVFGAMGSFSPCVRATMRDSATPFDTR